MPGKKKIYGVGENIAVGEMGDDALRARFARSTHTINSPPSPSQRTESLATLALGRGLSDEMIYYISPHHARNAQAQGLTGPAQKQGLVEEVTAFDRPGEYPLEVFLPLCL